MANNRVEKIGLNELELTNDDLFIRKDVNNLSADAVVIVEATHSALLIKDGVLQNDLEPGVHKIFDVKKGLFRNKKVGSIEVSVIYFSHTTELQVFWGTTSPFDLVDPITNVPIKFRMCGQFGVKILEHRKFYLNLMGANKEFTVKSLRDRLIGILKSEIGPAVEEAMKIKNISYIQFTEVIKKEVANYVQPIFDKKFREEYGLRVVNFILEDASLDPESKLNIENVIKKREAEIENDKLLEKEKENYTWWITEYERLKDKEIERVMLMKELESRDYAKYLEVCKVVGFNNELIRDKNEKNEKNENKGDLFCSKCGSRVKLNSMFCTKCGSKIGKKYCKKCGCENDCDCLFCSNCGSELI